MDGLVRRRSWAPRGRDVRAATTPAVARGETNAEIAHRLSLSINTVERHIANLYRKIEARGRADATAYASRAGIV